MPKNLSRQLSRDAPLSLEGRFMVKPSFLHIIRKVNGVDPKKVIFTFIALLIPILSQSSHNTIQGSAGWALQGPRDPSEEA